MNKLSKKLTLKYAFLQGTYWVSQCVIGSFAIIFLRSKGFQNTQIGLLLSFALVLGIILQLVIGSFADKTKKVSLRTIIMGLTLIVVASVLIMYIAPSSFWLIAVNYCLVSAIQTTLYQLINSLAVETINKGFDINYGLSRGMGSISFALTSYLLGLYVTNFGINYLLPIFLFLYCFLIISIFAFNIKAPKEFDLNTSEHTNKNPEEKVTAAPSGYIELFKNYKDFSILLIGIAMLFYSQNLISTYLINIVENVGGNSTNLGICLSITASVELPTMVAFTYIVRKVRCNTLIEISAFFFFVKVFILWLAPSVYVVYLSQAMQMLAYGLFTPASVYYVNSIVSEQDKVKGQSMLGVAMSIAGAIANISGGKLLDTIGVKYMLLLGAIVTAIGFIIVCISTKIAKQSYS